MDGRDKQEKCDSCNVLLGVQKIKNRREFKRRVIDPISNKLLVMCNACGLRLSRAGWKNKKESVKVPTNISKEDCYKEFELFTKAVCKILQDNDAAQLYCPTVTPKLCQCIQRYVIFGSNNKCKDVLLKVSGNIFENICREKVSELNELRKRAKCLIKMKTPKPANRKLTTSELKGCVKLRSKEYEQFVLTNRERLKKAYNLCERGVQRILCYSNNYLHKQLKSTPNGEARIPVKSAVVAKLLPDIKSLSEEKCCSRRCTRLALTHSRLLENWRDKALIGQRDARAVLAEMLTPAGGAVNCTKFLHLVTGCSPGLLAKVKKDVKLSAGIREPPEHGLREYWRRKKINAARNRDLNNTSSHCKNKNISDNIIAGSDELPIMNKNDIESSDTIRIPIEARTPVIVKKRGFNDDNLVSELQICNNKSNGHMVPSKSLSNEFEQCNENVNVDSNNRLSDSLINLLNDSCYQKNKNFATLPSTSPENVDFNIDQNSINELSLIQSVLTPNVRTSTEESDSTSKTFNVNEVNDEQQMQFIEITKLSSTNDVPARAEGPVPVQSVIILTPGCLLFNESLIVTT